MKPATSPASNLRRTFTGDAGIAAVSLVWFGMILGVSFLATPAKFLAPSLSLPVALDVGRHTFEVFAWVEIICGLALAGLAVFRAPARWVYAMVAVPCAIVALETVWLLPVLDARVSVIIAGGVPPASSLHRLYIALEALKLAALLVLGVWCLRRLVGAASQVAQGAGAGSGQADADAGPQPTPPGARVLHLHERRSRQ